jgi:hypothetical protein
MEERDELLRYLVAMPYALKDHMLREDKLVEDLQVRAGVCLFHPGCSLDCFAVTWLIQMPGGADGHCLMSRLHRLEKVVLITWNESMRARCRDRHLVVEHIPRTNALCLAAEADSGIRW